MRNLLIFTLLILSYSRIKSQDLLKADTNIVRQHLGTITKTDSARNYQNLVTLNFVAGYIQNELKKYCDTVYLQPYFVDGLEYKNVIGSIGTGKKERIVIGAHYDVAGNQEGADDNASGVTALLELSRLLCGPDLPYRIDFVAYTLEEPPFFRTKYMGSYVHAKSLFDSKEKVKGMICLEMIGYFSDQPKSQTYPLRLKAIPYGNKANYIMVVQRFGSGKFSRRFTKNMKAAEIIKTHGIKAPSIVPGIDYSDHLNYWKFDYSAVMITNTAFYRNRNYHEETDTMETLDLNKMVRVIDEVNVAVRNIK